MIPLQYVQPAVDCVPVAATTAYNCITSHGTTCVVVARAAGNLVCVTASGSSRTLAMKDGEVALFAIQSIDASSAIPVHVLVFT